ncbi:acyl-CoA thioesterase [Lacinutrix iliipiscaria]|uniref:Acyl-CoA thioesterase n=1 Tax=Lacinutrix iliipiscaria TaxID=1230532 RepID=A0ABW5WRP2_9FLAO
MKNLPKLLESKAKIRFQDCDPFNHLNNGSYINYFMNHREDELVSKYDIDIYKMANTIGKSWVSSSNQITYIRPALLMETVIIESQLINYTTSDLYVEMRMYNANKSQLKAVIWSGFTHFNLLKLSREQHTDELMKLFQSVHSPIDAKTFEERIKQIKKSSRKTFV